MAQKKLLQLAVQLSRQLQVSQKEKALRAKNTLMRSELLKKKLEKKLAR